VAKEKIPSSRVGRTAKIGGLAAGQAIRQAGTRAALSRPADWKNRPSRAIAWSREKYIVSSGDSIRLMPPAIAISLSPERKLWQARCTATSEDEQAVWTLTLGPRRLSRYEARVAR